eukprot:PITA_14632
MNSIRLVLSLAASLKWEVHQMDVKSAFFHGDLHEEIYMEQPIGFIQTDSSLVCRLKKSLYGLKQAPRACYAKMDSFLLESGFSRCYSDNTVYTKKVGNFLIIVVLYVDDLILTVLQSKEGISLSQSKYACDILRHFHMEDCKPAPSPFQSGVILSVSCTSPEVDATLYRQLVGKLLYLTHTRPDLSLLLAFLLVFCKTPVKVIGKQLKEYFVMFEVQYSLGFITVPKQLLYGCVSLMSVGLVTLMIGKSTAFICLHLGSGPITWACKKQVPVSLFRHKKQSIVVRGSYSVQHSAANTFELTLHFIRKSFMTMFLKWNIVQQMIRLQTSSQRLFTEAKFTKLRYMLGVQEVVTKGG